MGRMRKCPTCNGTEKDPRKRTRPCPDALCRGGNVLLDEMCDCECHDKRGILHVMPCCQYTYVQRSLLQEIEGMTLESEIWYVEDPKMPMKGFVKVEMPRINVKYDSPVVDRIVSVQPMSLPLEEIVNVPNGIVTLYRLLSDPELEVLKHVFELDMKESGDLAFCESRIVLIDKIMEERRNDGLPVSR